MIVEDNDYARLDEIMEEIAGINNTNKKLGKIVVAVGLCRYKGVGKMKQLFEIADACMYENKKELKDTLESSLPLTAHHVM